MAANPSNNRRKAGGHPNRAEPRQGALPLVNEAVSPKISGSRTQTVGARSGHSSTPEPSSAGSSPNPRTSPRAPGAQKSAGSTGRGARSHSSTALSPTGGAKFDSRAVGKASVKQPGQGGSASLQKINKERAAEIERETRGQRENQQWFKWRTNRITASVAHKISHCNFVNGKSNEIPQSYLKPILGQSSTVMNIAMKWGIDHEPVAVRKYEKLKSQGAEREVEVQSCGLFIDPAKNWLAASPDGVVVDKATKNVVGLLEVKCPYKHRSHTIAQACKDRNFCLESRDRLKKNHPYFTQIQCQMAVMGISKADLVVYTDRDIAVVPVEFDGKFWKETAEKLEDFYTRAVLPEIQQENPVLAKEE